jgi:hypothetical protein
MNNHSTNKSLTRIAHVCLPVLVTTSVARAEDDKETRYGKNRRDDYQSSGGMNPRQQSVPRRRVWEGSDRRQKREEGAKAARPRAHFMACKCSQSGMRSKLTPTATFLLLILMNAPPSIRTLHYLVWGNIQQMSGSRSTAP